MSDEKRCGNCAHWGAVYEYYDDGEFEDRKVPEFRKCDEIVHIGKHTADPYTAVGNLPNKVSAFTLDASGYRADLWTREDFNCALWVPK